MRDRTNRTISLCFTDTDRAVSSVFSVAVMTGVGLLLAGLVYTGVSAMVGDTLRENPDADISMNPGADEATLIIHGTTNTDYVNVTVNGVSVSNTTGKTLAASNGATITFDNTGSDGNVNISRVDRDAWDSTDGHIASGTRFVVTATNAPDQTLAVFEFEQP